MSEKNDAAGHRERLKRLFMNSGLEGFEPHNALELLLFYSIPRIDTKPIAKELISTFGSFDRVLEASPEELVKVKGVGKETATFLKLVLAASAYYVSQKESKDAVFLKGTIDTIKYVKNMFFGKSIEICYAICLDNQNKVINCVKMSEGSIERTPLEPRDLVSVALQNKATSIILVHNHPGGPSSPSAGDYEVTKVCKQALNSIKIDLLDHIIVGERNITSLASSDITIQFDDRNIIYKNS